MSFVEAWNQICRILCHDLFEEVLVHGSGWGSNWVLQLCLPDLLFNGTLLKSICEWTIESFNCGCFESLVYRIKFIFIFLHRRLRIRTVEFTAMIYLKMFWCTSLDEDWLECCSRFPDLLFNGTLLESICTRTIESFSYGCFQSRVCRRTFSFIFFIRGLELEL